MDFLDDPFSEPTVTKAPAAGRFQPKAKPRLKIVPAPAVKATKESSVTSVLKDLGLNKLVQPEIVVEKKSNFPNKTSFSDTDFLENSLEDGNLPVKEKEVAGSAAIEHSETIVSGPSKITVGTSETPNPDASVIHSEEEQSVFSNVSFASASPLRPCKSQNAPDQSVNKILQDSEFYEEPSASGDGDFEIDVEQLGAGDFSCLDNMDIMSEGRLASEKKAVKLLPKPKALGGRQKDLADAETYPPHALELPPGNQHTMMNGSIHGGEPDTASHAFHTTLDDRFLVRSFYQSDTLVTDNAESTMRDDFPQQIRENHGEQGSHAELDSSAKSIDEGYLSRPEVIEEGFEFDGINDGFHDDSFTYDKVPNELASKKAENSEGNHLGEETSKKRKSRKTKKEGPEKDKSTRKRKTAAQKAEESAKKPPKKFPHATRRKRCVDRSLLEAPEDELDLQRVPIRDLIVLAEYKERQAKKEATTLPPPPTSERIDNISEDLPYNDNEIDLYGDAYDNPSTPVVQADTGYFNYQTFMTKETRARWTKQDTELFYQGISQFGSDLSMIQQLFPGRTRHQIKLKYKKEERQNPMRLHDSLTGRAKDLSHFVLVIGRLQEQAARDAKAEEDSACPTGEDEMPEEAAPSTHEVNTESKKEEEGKAADQEPNNRPHVESPPKSYLSEEDDFDWSEYKSEL